MSARKRTFEDVFFKSSETPRKTRAFLCRLGVHDDDVADVWQAYLVWYYSTGHERFKPDTYTERQTYSWFWKGLRWHATYYLRLRRKEVCVDPTELELEGTHNTERSYLKKLRAGEVLEMVEQLGGKEMREALERMASGERLVSDVFQNNGPLIGKYYRIRNKVRAEFGDSDAKED